MTAETLARWQFGITTVYHFLFVPLTIAMSMLVAILQTIWVRTGHEKYLKLTKFFGKLFLINFAMGVVTGIVQEFQFGMNWSEYSRFVGDIFGAPLALEALLAFFLESVFIGLWSVKGTLPRHSPDPYMPPSAPGPHSTVVDLERMPELDGYSGRLVIEWGGGERAWVQYADRRDKEVVELRRRVEEPQFPGIGEFSCGLHEVDSLPESWQELLRTARGVYLLVHRTTGAQYVGSATGAGGFLGRWRGYADGHGGNLALRELGHAADNYDAWILETAGSAATVDDVYALESRWKKKLGSRAQGLNRN